jgi:hypothetical protein
MPAASLAYVDPGSGIVLWQGLVAAIGAALVFIRKPLASLKRLFDRMRGR